MLIWWLIFGSFQGVNARWFYLYLYSVAHRTIFLSFLDYVLHMSSLLRLIRFYIPGILNVSLWRITLLKLKLYPGSLCHVMAIPILLCSDSKSYIKKKSWCYLMRMLISHKCQSTIRPSIYFSLIVKSCLNLLLEPTSTIKQWGWSFLLKETTRALDGAQSHDRPITSQHAYNCTRPLLAQNAENYLPPPSCD